MLWDELKPHINPAEVDKYAREIGVARIARNQGTFRELSMLQQMQNTIQDDLTNEFQKKNLSILACPQRTKAISRATRFLDSLRAQGHFVDPQDPADSQVLKYLKIARVARPSTTPNPPMSRWLPLSARSTRSVHDTRESIGESVTEIQGLIDEEFSVLQTEIAELRCSLFASCEELNQVKSIDPPSTAAIEAFGKRLQTQEVAVKGIGKAKGSAASRLRDSIRLSRLWE
jgi:CHAD domain-containing protein